MRDRRLDVAAAIWLLGALLVVLVVFDDYGATPDEAKHHHYGDLIVRYFTSGFQDLRARSFSRDYLYGGAFDALGSLFRRVAPLPPLSAGHLFGGLVGWLGIVGTWRLARALGGSLAGLAAAIAVTLTPVYWGQMFGNPKDIPMAVGYVWALYILVRLIASYPAVRPSLWAKVALGVGAAMSVRIAGLLTLCFLALIVVGMGVRHLHWRGHHGARAWVRSFALPALLAGIAAWALMLLLWPWAHTSPIAGPLHALGYMSNFPLTVHRIPFAGELVATYAVPWDYVPRLLMLKLPIPIVLLAGAAVGLGWRALARGRLSRREWGCALVALAIVFPPVYAMLKGSSLYAGLRHFLFVVPPIVVAASLAFAAIARRVRAARLVYGVGAVLAAAQAVAMVQIHPLQYGWFNQLAGSTAGAVGRYEVDYANVAYKQAVPAFLDELWRREPDAFLGQTFTVRGCGGRFNLPPNFVDQRGDPDFFLATTRPTCGRRFRGAPVYFTFERGGAPFVVVRDLRGWQAPPKRSRKQRGSR